MVGFVVLYATTSAAMVPFRHCKLAIAHCSSLIALSQQLTLAGIMNSDDLTDFYHPVIDIKETICLLPLNGCL